MKIGLHIKFLQQKVAKDIKMSEINKYNNFIEEINKKLDKNDAKIGDKLMYITENEFKKLENESFKKIIKEHINMFFR